MICLIDAITHITYEIPLETHDHLLCIQCAQPQLIHNKKKLVN